MKFLSFLIVFFLSLNSFAFAQENPAAKPAITPIADILRELGGGPVEPKQSHQSLASIKTPQNSSDGAAVETHVVENGENPWTIAKKHGVSMEQLVAFNEIENSRDLKVGQVLKIPEKPASSGGHTPNPNVKEFDARGYKVYTIAKGDNPWTIARDQNVDYDALVEINEIENPRDLKVGQQLRLPNPGQRSAKAESMAADAAELAKITPQKAPFDADGHEVYIVKKGENPWTIARRLKINYEDFLSLNEIENPRGIKIGQKLKLPKES